MNFVFEQEGRPHQLAELRRRPVMLVLMRTSEIVSQIYMKEITGVFEKRAGKLRILVLTVEPTEAPFVDMYARSEDLPFFIGVAEESVLLGASSLGVIPAIPMTYLIDAGGRVVYTRPGVIPEDELVSEIDELLDF